MPEQLFKHPPSQAELTCATLDSTSKASMIPSPHRIKFIMSVLPSASVALDSLERDGDLGLQRAKEHGSSSAIDAEAATRQQEEPQKPNSNSNSKKQRPKKVRIRPQLRRSCFLCPRGRGKVQHAIRVPCFQPEPVSQYMPKEDKLNPCHCPDVCQMANSRRIQRYMRGSLRLATSITATGRSGYRSMASLTYVKPR